MGKFFLIIAMYFSMKKFYPCIPYYKKKGGEVELICGFSFVESSGFLHDFSLEFVWEKCRVHQNEVMTGLDIYQSPFSLVIKMHQSVSKHPGAEEPKNQKHNRSWGRFCAELSPGAGDSSGTFVLPGSFQVRSGNVC